MKSWVAVIGPGAIGGLLAASLRRSGRPVMLVCRGRDQAALLRRRGLSVADAKGDARLWQKWLEITHDPKPRPGCAAVFLCVKAGQLRPALRAARVLAGSATPVVGLLNGLDHVDPMLRALGSGRAVFGACYAAAMRTGPAGLLHMGGRDVFLAEEPGNRAAARAARAVLSSAGWRVRVCRSRQRLLWTKLVLNAAVNPLGALTRKTNGELARDPALRELLGESVREAARVARAAGCAPLYPDMERRAIASCLRAPDQLNSMVQDLAAGRPTEADAILRPLLSAARRARIQAPVADSLYRMVKRLEKELTRG